MFRRLSAFNQRKQISAGTSIFHLNKLDKKAVFTNTASQVVVRFLMLIITLVTVKLLANYIGAKGVGNYNTITTYINFFIVIADLGLFSVTVREISKKPENEQKIINNVFAIRLISALLAVLVAILIVFLTKYSLEIKYGVIIASGFLFFNLLASVYDSSLQYRLKMQFSALAELISKTLSIIALILVIYFAGNFLWVMSTVAVFGVGIFIFKWLFARRYVRFSPELDKKIGPWIFQMAWPLGIVFIINNLFFKIDTLILYAFKGATVTGVYTVAYKVLEVTAFIGSYFSSALKPAISQNIKKNSEYVGKVIERGINIMIFAATPIVITALVFSKDIILLISNAEFVSGASALVVLSFTLPLIFLVVLFSEVLIANDSRKTLVAISLSILIFNILLNLFLIPRYSLMGAAWTTLISEILLVIIYYIYANKVSKINLNLKPAFLSILAGAISAYAGYLIYQNVSIHFAFPLVVMLSVFFLLGALFKTFSIRELTSLIKS